VNWLGAVQAQDYAGAKWALGLRLKNPRDDAVERAFNKGEILRTHVMRPTWHFVTREDIRWLVRLTAHRVDAANAFMVRQAGLDGEQFARSRRTITHALSGGQSLTRDELTFALDRAGLKAKGLRLVYMLMKAELDGVVCSGPRRENKFTYALMDDRAPQIADFDRKSALGDLVERYFRSHGPATLRDFTWWSGLTASEAREGLAEAGSRLRSEDSDGTTYWFGAPVRLPDSMGGVLLLPTYDEFLVGYTSFDKTRRGGGQDLKPLLFTSVIISRRGEVMGSWNRQIKKGTVQLNLAPFAKLSSTESEACEEAAERYGAFVGLPVALTIQPS
jgi:Winged helix DNA-binding domain